MPTPIPTGMRLGDVAPQDAIAAFQQRKLLEPSFRWQDVFQAEHARAVAVAGVTRLDVLAAFQQEIGSALSEGRGMAGFQARMRSRLAELGWAGPVEVTDPTGKEVPRTVHLNNRRLALIFDVNMRQSHAAGRWARIERTQERFPLVMYRTMRDERVRGSHKQWDSLALPVNHPFWNTHYPPNGWRCRCTAFAVDQRDLDRRRAAGETIKTEAPDVQWVTYVNPRTGEIAPVPHGIDPGFGYNPGKQRDAAFFGQMMGKAMASTPLAAAVVVAEATRSYPGMVAKVGAEFAALVDEVVSAGVSRGRVSYIGALKPAAMRALAGVGIEPRHSAIAVLELDVLHALRDSKAQAGGGVPLSVYRRLPELLAHASALLMEVGSNPPALLYVIDLVREDGEVAKAVLQLDVMERLRLDGQRVTVPVNKVRTVTVLNPQALQDRKKYQLIWGRVE